MWFPKSFPVAFALLLVGMVFWGSWINAYRIAEGWRLELFHLDYSIGVLLVAVLAAGTAGVYFSSPSVGENLLASDRSAWLWAAGGGVFVNAGNFALMAAIRRMGMAVAFPIAVGLSLILGTFLSYSIMPRGDPRWLGVAVALIFAGVLTNSYAYQCRTHGERTSRWSWGDMGICILSGICFTFSSPMVAKALSSPKPLAPYGACILFALGSLLAAAPLLLYFLRYTPEVDRLELADYFHGSFRNHAAGQLGGVMWGAGMLFTFIPAGLVGMGIASAVGQADPLVASLWGIFVWHEFQDAPARAQISLAVMFALFLAGLLAIGLCYRGR